MPPLIPAYGQISPTFWEQHQSEIIMAGTACAALAFLLLKLMLRPKAVVVLPPETVARQALARLQGQPANGKLLSEISQILHRYVCTAFGLPSAEMTTAEFSTTLAANEKIGVDLARAVSSFLRECDERKFSPASSTAPFNAVSCALELISLAEKRHLQSAPAAAVKLNSPADPDAAVSGDRLVP